MTDRVCPLCKRHVSQLSRHHLLPRARGGKEEHVLHICFDCHDAVHEFFDNSELARRYTSIEALLSNERFARHVASAWRDDRRIDDGGIFDARLAGGDVVTLPGATLRVTPGWTGAPHATGGWLLERDPE